MTTTDKTYRYSGPMSGVTLREGKKKTREVMLIPGKTVQLPAGNPHVQALVARGHLTEEAPAKAPASTATKPKAKQEEK